MSRASMAPLLAACACAAAAAQRVGYEEYHAEALSTADGTLRYNTQQAVSAIARAHEQSVDLFVWPEYGITGFGAGGQSAWIPYSIPIPDALVDTVPCDAADAHSTLHDISCAARKHGVAVVIDVVEKVAAGRGRTFLYNTAVAFNKAGRLVGRGRKANLWGEGGYLDVPQECGTSVFTLDEGAADAVKFGLFVCADLIFYHPAVNLTAQGVHHFVVPVAWDNSMAQMQVLAYAQGWSLVNDATIIVANHRTGAESGSGVFVKGRRVSATYSTARPQESSSLVVTDIPREAAAATPVASPSVGTADAGRPGWSKEWTLTQLAPTAREYCTGGGTCCTVDPKGDPSAGEYVVGVLDGLEPWYGLQWGAVACGVWPGSAASHGPFAYARPTRGIASLTLTLNTTTAAAQFVPEVVFTSPGGADNQAVPDSLADLVTAGGRGLDVAAPASAVLTSAVVYGRVFERDVLAYTCTPRYSKH